MRLPPRGVVRFLGWHVLKLEFWHFGPWTKNLGFCFRIGICGIFYKKKPAFGTLHCPTTCSPHPFASCFSVFSVSVAFPSFFAVFGPSLDFLHMPASTCSSLSFLCAVIFLNLLVLFGGAVRSWEVWGGVFSFCFLHLLVLFGGVVRCGRGGGWGGGGGADDVHANATCFFLFVFFIFLCCLVVRCGRGGGGGGGLLLVVHIMIRNSNADPYNNKDQPHSNPEPHTATELLRCCHAQPFANPQNPHARLCSVCFCCRQGGCAVRPPGSKRQTKCSC